MTNLIQKRVDSHRTEQFRLYQTPAGFRIIATHETILPNDSLVAEWFEHFHADANYVRLCQSQQCFRARLTAKPWRMAEVTETSKLAKNIPTIDFWSMTNEDIDSDGNEWRHAELDARNNWIADYDRFAQGYRACQYIGSFKGRDIIEDKLTQATINDFIDWHDRACEMDTDLPLA